MPAYLHPGVYTEEISSGSKPIEGVGTSTAAFIGYAVKGPVNQPVLITKWDDYVSQYGGIQNFSGAGIAGHATDHMGFSVFAFFQNGGKKAYIVRLAVNSGNPNELTSASATQPGENANVLTLTAANPGTWADNMRIRFSQEATGTWQVEAGFLDKNGNLVAQEVFTRLSLTEGDPNYIVDVIAEDSDLFVVTTATALGDLSGEAGTSGTATGSDTGFPEDLSAANEAARTLTIAIDGNANQTAVLSASNYADIDALINELNTQLFISSIAATATANADAVRISSNGTGASSSVAITNSGVAATIGLDNPTVVAGVGLDGLTMQLSGGGNGIPAGLPQFNTIYSAFLKIRDVNIICLPGQTWDGGTGQSIIAGAISHAEATTNRMVIFDPATTELTTQQQINALGLSTSTYGVLYYPWVHITNPFFNADTNPGAARTVAVPPSSFAAGMWAKIDGKRGVWKAPAGVEAALSGALSLDHVVEDGEQDILNPLGINAYRKLPGYGHVIWGSRTRSTQADPEWRYVPVRRTAIFIRESIFNGIQWAVFEPNNHMLWSSLRGNIESFMNGLFRAGAFQGQKASDAYFVRCGLDDTMTQGDIDAGRVIVIVGFAPLKPAEFVIVRITQKVGQQ